MLSSKLAAVVHCPYRRTPTKPMRPFSHSVPQARTAPRKMINAQARRVRLHDGSLLAFPYACGSASADPFGPASQLCKSGRIADTLGTAPKRLSMRHAENLP